MHRLINPGLKFFLFVLILQNTVTAFSQPQKSTKTIINFKSEILLLRDAKNAVTNFSYTDKGAIAEGLYQSGDTKILYLPEGVYLLKKNILLFKSGLHIKGAGIGKTIIRYDGDLQNNSALFESNGASDITIEGITFTGNEKKIKAILEFNSYPNKCKNIRVINCEFINLWTDEAINFGGASMGETHSNDNVLIDHCRFKNIYNPSQRIVTNDTDPKCIGVNLQQTTLRAVIQYCTFQNISGDGIFGWGWSQDNRKINFSYGNWNIHHNNLSYCWMCVEINGNGLGSGLYIHDNTMKFSTRDYGYLISVDSYKARIIKNNLYNVDRALIEYTAIEGLIANNVGTITTWKKNAGGVRSSQKFDRVACVELYGYNNLIEHNRFTLNRTAPDAFSPTEYNGIKLVGKTTDPASQPLDYKGITDYSAYWTISENTITGFTHKVIDATNDKIRNVVIKKNVFRSRYEVATPIEIYGYNWQIINNTFDLSGSKKRDGNRIVGVFYRQKDKTGSVAASNTISGEGWDAANKYVFDGNN